MRLGVTSIMFAVVALVQPAIHIERPSWVDTVAANFPAEIASIVFPNGTVWDSAHPTINIGRWQFTRSGPLTERISAAQLGNVPCTSPDRGDCFYGYVRQFGCYNPADPTLTRCVLTLSWTVKDGAKCEIIAGTPCPPYELPCGPVSFRITCPKEIHYVD